MVIRVSVIASQEEYERTLDELIVLTAHEARLTPEDREYVKRLLAAAQDWHEANVLPNLRRTRGARQP